MGLVSHNHEGEFNKDLTFIKASIPLKEDFTKEPNTWKKKPDISLFAPSKGKNP